MRSTNARRLGVLAAAFTAAAFASTGVAAAVDPPATTPTNLSVDGTSGTLTFHATSTAPLVEFEVDGAAVGAPVAVTGGAAAFNWPSYGYTNAPHTLTAKDCADSVTCGAASTGLGFTIANAAPVITAPVDGADVRGGFPISATSPGGAVQFLVDGNVIGSDATSPYAINYPGPSLTAGPHTILAVQCSVDLVHCDGPASAQITVNATVLHPSIASIAPTPFSPNGDGVKDTTKLSYSLDESQAVQVEIKNSYGTVVRTASLGTLGTGSHTWTWSGRKNDGVVAANGVYSVGLKTSKLVNGVAVLGKTTTHVRVDKTAPYLSSISGGGSTFYPYRDDYKDYFQPRVTLSEYARLRLTIYNSSGHVVRTIEASKSAGRVYLTWNGRNSSSVRVAAGTYYWTYRATDAAGNRRTSGKYSVHVSDKRLIYKSATLTKNGDAFTAVETNDNSCNSYSTAASDFDHGVWLDNYCDPTYDGFVLIQARYSFAVPSAVRYGTISVRAYGNTISPPSEIFAVYFGGSSPIARVATANEYSSDWYALGSVNGDGKVTSTHRMRIAVGVDNNYDLSDFDIGSVRMTVHYYVLG
jgi:flagellar hook assembly protein FlgD